MGGRGMSVAVLLAVLLGGCTSGSGGPRTPAKTASPSEDPEEEFAEDITDLCVPYRRAAAAVGTAKGRAQLAQRLDRMVDTSEDLLREARRQDPPPTLKKKFDLYLSTLRSAINLRHQILLEPKNLSHAVNLDLRLAKTEKKLFRVARAIGLSLSCPPSDERGVDLFLASAKANQACFRLFQKIKKSEALKQSLVTRTTARAALVTLLDFQERMVATLKRLRSKDLDDPVMDKLIDVLRERTEVLRELIADFDNFDQGSYEADLKRYEALWKKVKKLADKANVDACTYVVPKS